ncbi:tyrosine-type recombinase/integrase [Streptomyces sp. H27-S2]|uniref:tyrosine-type recombinase/integrase n=1 Tax=Streptomyces antarcticus TaxID=2996458 RepID=UPI002271E86D|nr:site-specific integrase [Streptomyces sp. H27-S2]MCY0948000.1 site-specific integrase [Streptomyces sp. H27-S2]
MATLVPRKNRDGEITSYQVKWHDGGARTGEWQHERFDDEDAAKVFKKAVEDLGHKWPSGWVKGKGYIDPEVGDEAQYRFEGFARRSISNRTVGDYYKRQRIRALEMYIFPSFGNCDVRSAEHFSKATIGAWINKMRITKVRRGRGKPKDMSSGTLRGLHGLLSSILKEAMVAEPPLRDRNPCDLTRLPKDDEHGVDDDSGDEMEFMTPEEVAGLVDCFPRASDRMLVRTAYGTGLRWGEITALAAQHVRSPLPGQHEVRVTRAWKRRTPTDFYLGPPKSPASRRTVRIPVKLWLELQEFGLAEEEMDVLVFRALDGGRIRYGTFWERWNRAVAKAKKEGLLPDWKFPTFHDLRHSHVAALLSDGHSLTYVQRRLGHESIVTTSDRYGHLLETAHKAALVTLDRVMEIRVDDAPAGEAAVEEPVKLPAQSYGEKVHAVHLGAHVVGFWDGSDAQAVAEQWELDRGEPASVEALSAAWWQRAVPGGLGTVRRHIPARVKTWTLGPACYEPDGTERVATPEAQEPRSGWVWEWEENYTTEAAVQRVEHRPDGHTEASAWGVQREAVVAAFAEARAEALRVCALNPFSRTATGEGQESTV